MSDRIQGYQVNLAELEQITARVGGFVGFLNDSLSGLKQRTNAVQQTWNGTAADAQAAAFQKWLTGATEVAEGIDAIRRTAQEAHDRYTTAVETNLRMLGRR
ncbi:WXG100 family type VII secretion target [Nocardia sp. NPDC059177]|uniref:WXG100 family type VII secretion target n=1 Tax=Nocardia sp. NPDC059177 TaxID=3346759 RepID=UPI00367AA68B